MQPPAIENILIPVDFSELSREALRFASPIAHCSKARLTVLFANPFQPPPYFTSGRLEALEAAFREEQRNAERALWEFAREALGGEEFSVIVRDALPAEAIRKTAQEIGADLILMGTHGRSGINRFLLGSVAERILRESEIPVITVRRGDGARHGTQAVKRVLCPVNDSHAARKALAYAARLSGCLGAHLTVLHVREPGAEKSIQDLCDWVPDSVRTECGVEEIVRHGGAATEILRLASEGAYDLLAVGSEHRRFFDSAVIGTTTVRVVRHAPIPVLSVPVRMAE